MKTHTHQAVIGIFAAGILLMGGALFRPIQTERMNQQLVQAAQSGDGEAAANALQNGADPNLAVCTDYEPVDWLHWARGYVPRQVLPKTCWATEPVLVLAARAPSSKAVAALVAHHAALDVCDNDDNTPLRVAIENKNKPSVQILLDAGANPSYAGARSTGRVPPLSTAMYDKDTTILRLLIKYGADVSAEADGNTLLQDAAATGNLSALKILLKSGAAIDKQNGDGDTALTKAALNHQISAVRFLLEQGANPKLRTNDGETALSYAQLPDASPSDKKIAALLRTHNAASGPSKHP